MRPTRIALATILGCSIGAGAACLRADEPAPAPQAERPAERPKAERRSPAQAAAHQLDMLRERQARQPLVPHAKQHESVRKAFRESLRHVRAGTVTVLDGDEQAALGTVVGSDGLVLTKASELRGQPTIRLADGTKHAAAVVGISEEHDLALLKIGRSDLQPVTWAAAEPALGSWLATAGSGELPVAVGVASVATRPLRSRVLLGIALRPEADKAIVDKVFPGSTAAKIGLRPDDVVTRIADREIAAPATVVELLRDRQPGDTVQVAVRRGEETLEFTARLEADGGLPPHRQDRLDRMNTLAGDLSARRGNFPRALQHDTVLKPEECGGPLVNLDGEVVGINIARAGRIESYALTPADIRPLLEEMQSGKHPPDEKLSHLLEGRGIDSRIERQEKMLRAAERAEAAAERNRADAAKALEGMRRKRREWVDRAP
ncbi:MAG: trypsin-like peptidase domain-containing protein [Planctomycetia bacterium]|jgi:serine protease Do